MPIPKCPDAPAILGSNIKSIKLNVKLTTPMFGGGVVAREVDKKHPIRETGIRGQLQFWWRATVGATYSTSADLFKAQEKIWGSTKLKSKVTIHIERVGALNPISYQGVVDQAPSLKYALFPFAKNNQTEQASGIKAGLDFALSIQSNAKDLSDEQWAGVQCAVKAWINFGGVGSRTRRGCGSLFSPDISFQDCNTIQLWLKNHGTDFIRDWPTLSKTFLCRPEPINPILAWADSISLIQRFRQGPGFGRNEGNKNNNHPGRSRFPEPDTIRRLTKSQAPNHAPEARMPDGFPRAEFGLPIIFQFKDKRTGDPQESTLIPNLTDKERFASPLILKSIASSESKAFSAIVVLNGNRVQSCRLMLNGKPNKASTEVPIQSPRFKDISPSPIRGHVSAIDAFLAYAKTEGYSNQ